jgi:hypothetical protein
VIDDLDVLLAVHAVRSNRCSMRGDVTLDKLSQALRAVVGSQSGSQSTAVSRDVDLEASPGPYC